MLTTKFYTNDDESREVDAAGIQLLDDSLLIDDDGTDRQALLEQKAEELCLLQVKEKPTATNSTIWIWWTPTTVMLGCPPATEPRSIYHIPAA